MVALANWMRCGSAADGAILYSSSRVWIAWTGVTREDNITERRLPDFSTAGFLVSDKI